MHSMPFDGVNGFENAMGFPLGNLQKAALELTAHQKEALKSILSRKNFHCHEQKKPYLAMCASLHWHHQTLSEAESLLDFHVSSCDCKIASVTWSAFFLSDAHG